jgi:HAD superfamily hydrolase (TIGR01459 family)
VHSAEEADFLLAIGIIGSEHDFKRLESVFDAALCRNLPLVIANPDRHVRFDNTVLVGAGSVAAPYAARGGTVHTFGKPDPEIFRTALRLVNQPANHALVIGDSFETDIVGARAAGITAVPQYSWLMSRKAICGGIPSWVQGLRQTPLSRGSDGRRLKWIARVFSFSEQA